MPEVPMQERFTGSSGDSTLREGFNAYKIFKNCYETHIGPVGTCRVLDFGCDNGQFCYESHGLEGRWSYWGEACIPKDYVEKRWKEIFDVCEYIDNLERCPQNVIVVRKRAWIR
jgi:hypothetical protein